MSRPTDSRKAGVSLPRAPRRKQARDSAAGSRGPGAGTEPPSLPGLDEEDIDPDELREFMADDWADVKADPGFREQLRRRLWDMLRQSRRDGDDPADD
jgi:hypothetical protein